MGNNSFNYKQLFRTHRAILSRLRMLRHYRGDPRRPSMMHLTVTDKCNMSCVFCLYKNDNKNFRILDPDKARSLIHEIDSPVILLSGGEPLLPGRVLEVTREITRTCREAGKIVGVLTNGVTLEKVLTKNYPEFRPSKNFFFQISIDGLKDEHDRLRGHFDLIMKNILLAKSMGQLIYTNTVVSSSNIQMLNEIIEFISGFSDRIYINPMVNTDNMLDKEELKKLGGFIVNHQNLNIGNSINYGKFLKGERELRCMFHSLVSITPTAKIKFPCYCFGEGAEYVESYGEFLKKAYGRKEYYEGRADPLCRGCRTHCLHEASVYTSYYWNEIYEQAKRPKCLHTKYIAPLFRAFK